MAVSRRAMRLSKQEFLKRNLLWVSTDYAGLASKPSLTVHRYHIIYLKKKLHTIIINFQRSILQTPKTSKKIRRRQLTFYSFPIGYLNRSSASITRWWNREHVGCAFRGQKHPFRLSSRSEHRIRRRSDQRFLGHVLQLHDAANS